MRNSNWLKVGLLAAALPLGACGDVFEVTSPGRTADTDLNNTDAFPALVTGMSYDLAQGIDGALQEISLASGELWHGGSYDFGDIPRGIILPEDINGAWAGLHQARWVAETGVERMRAVYSEAGQEAQFGRSALVARAYLLAGIANRTLGENMCEAVIDGGERQPNAVHFKRAEEQFTKAIEIGTAAKATAIVNAAYGGRASVRAWQGNWAAAAEDASKVPPTFLYEAMYQLPSPDNDLAYETHVRFEFTVFNTRFDDDPSDPRAPWRIVRRNDGSIATGQNGSTPMYQQMKYTAQTADIPLVKGTEMLVLRAEAALRDGNIAAAFVLLNQARAVYGMKPLPVPTSMATAWQVLQEERLATNWLEARALWDLRRWNAETGPAKNNFLDGRDKCIPISENEMQSNLNLR